MAYDVAFDMCYFYNVHQGGKDEVAYNLLRGFEEIGVSSRILCFCHKPLVPMIQKINPNVGIHVVPRIRAHGHFADASFWLRSRYIRYTAPKLGIKVMVFPNKPSANIRFPMTTIEIPHDIQVFATGQIPGVSYTKKGYKRHTRELINDFQNRDHIISISDFDRSEMIKYMPWADQKIKRIYNPIRFTELPADKSIAKEYITVLNIQWMHKNPETVLKAFRRIADQTDLKLLLVGRDGPNGAELRRFVQEENLQDRVVFTGFVSNEELEQIIHKTRIYVNASFFEGFGMTAVELMGREVPTIVAKTTAMPEVTRGLCRYYEPADDSQALAAVIVEELNHPYSDEKLKAIADEMKNTYSYVNIASEYWNFFEECMTK